MCLIGARAVEAVGLLNLTRVLAAQYPGVPHKAGQAACRERAPAEAKEVELVPRVVGLHQEPVAVDHVAGQAEAERATGEPLKTARADALLVVDELLVSLGVLAGHAKGELGHVGGAAAAAAIAVRLVPGPVAADDEASAHAPLSSRPAMPSS